MPIARVFTVLMITLLALSGLQPQTVPATAPRPTSDLIADESNQPKLEHFDPNVVDKSLDPCNDFYKYSCTKWLSANPIPADQVFWSTGSSLQLWHGGVLREALEAAARNDSQRSPVQQKIGDYWTACIDESAIE